MYPVVFLF